MNKRLILVTVVGFSASLALLAASAEPVPPACVVVAAEPVHVQAGYAPSGPEDCTTLPPASR